MFGIIETYLMAQSLRSHLVSPFLKHGHLYVEVNRSLVFVWLRIPPRERCQDGHQVDRLSSKGLQMYILYSPASVPHTPDTFLRWAPGDSTLSGLLPSCL